MKLLTKMLVTAGLSALVPLSAQAQQTIKVGLVLPMSGPCADYGLQISNGVKLYMARHGNTMREERSKSSSRTIPASSWTPGIDAETRSRIASRRPANN